MAKQKVKHPGKPPSDASPAASGETPSPVIAPSKSRGKRKAQLKLAVTAGGKARAPKRAGKMKLKAMPRANPAAVAVPTVASVAKSLRETVLGRIAGRTPPHKIARKARLGPLERLEFAIDEVRHGLRTSPRTRKLQLSGIPKMAQKVIEEAGEAAIEAVVGNRTALINESVDLLYNLMMLLSEAGVPIAAIWAEVERRELVLGMAEKLPKAGDHEV